MTDIERACEYRCAMKPCKHICEYAALYVAGMNAGRKEREGEIKQVEKNREETIANYEQLIKEYDQTEKEYAELKIIAANRGAFIDWCAEHHEEILKEYTGFMEAKK